MKTHKLASAISLGLAIGLLSTVSISSADETVTKTKSTTYSGTVSEINPSSSTIILKSESSAAPVTYTYSKETTFVDSAGKTITADILMNSPVTVEYSNEGGRTVVRRVVQTGPARKVERTTTHTETDMR